MNLPYSAESTETGTAGDTVSVVLRERLNSSTVYYYTVSAVSADIIVTVQGTFVTPLYSKQGNNVSLLLTINYINVYCIHIYIYIPANISLINYTKLLCFYAGHCLLLFVMCFIDGIFT